MPSCRGLAWHPRLLITFQLQHSAKHASCSGASFFKMLQVLKAAQALLLLFPPQHPPKPRGFRGMTPQGCWGRRRIRDFPESVFIPGCQGNSFTDAHPSILSFRNIKVYSTAAAHIDFQECLKCKKVSVGFDCNRC